mmetsp:Transcript_12544/g.41570  ORF Transcript_12544/g.41570 Transcript_12544/m.41570 type:complete len:87 (-) Transcript_12544:498-758(-)
MAVACSIARQTRRLLSEAALPMVAAPDSPPVNHPALQVRAARFAAPAGQLHPLTASPVGQLHPLTASPVGQRHPLTAAPPAQLALR